MRPWVDDGQYVDTHTKITYNKYIPFSFLFFLRKALPHAHTVF